MEEAIVAHGGEAEPARQAFQAMSTDDQEHLVQFLKSLWSPDALTAEKGRISRIFSIDGQKYAVD